MLRSGACLAACKGHCAALQAPGTDPYLTCPLAFCAGIDLFASEKDAVCALQYPSVIMYVPSSGALRCRADCGEGEGRGPWHCRDMGYGPGRSKKVCGEGGGSVSFEPPRRQWVGLQKVQKVRPQVKMGCPWGAAQLQPLTPTCV